MCPPLGNLVGNVANGVNGACAPIPAFRSNTSSASWPLRLPGRANSFPHLPTAWRTRSGNSANSLTPVPLRLSGYVLTRNVPMVSTSFWSRYVCNWMLCSQPRSLLSKRRVSCQTGPCQRLQDLRAPARKDGPLKANRNLSSDGIQRSNEPNQRKKCRTKRYQTMNKIEKKNNKKQSNTSSQHYTTCIIVSKPKQPDTMQNDPKQPKTTKTDSEQAQTTKPKGIYLPPATQNPPKANTSNHPNNPITT